MPKTFQPKLQTSPSLRVASHLCHIGPQVILNINIGIVEDAFHEAKHRSSAGTCGDAIPNPHIAHLETANTHWKV